MNSGYYYTTKDYSERIEFYNWVNSLESDPEFQKIAKNYKLYWFDKNNSSNQNLTKDKNML